MVEIKSIKQIMYDELIQNFRGRNIEVTVVSDYEGACQKILELVPHGSTVGYSGSITLETIGILDKIRAGDYVFFDRARVVKYSKDSYDLGHQAQHADYFLSGTNAITKKGQIVNVDRTGNRVSSLIYGPNHVVIVIGKNKIVPDVDAALKRIKEVAAPLNAKRMKVNTPCALTGKCGDCNSADRLCCNTVIIEKQFKKNRMEIILVDQDLGY